MLRNTFVHEVPVFPGFCVPRRFTQSDDEEYECSAAEARERWTAETLFTFVTDTPSLKGVIPYHFLHFVEETHAVAYLNNICRIEFSDKNYPPKGWAKAKTWLKLGRLQFERNTASNEQEV